LQFFTGSDYFGGRVRVSHTFYNHGRCRRCPGIETSLAGGIVYMFQLVGGALGLAIVTTIFTYAAKRDVTDKISGYGLKLSEQYKADILSFILGSGSKH
ncbi:MAG: hypothetical protein ACHQ6U_11820, partial [Thermodesulfobacteriota bacterium]